MRKIFKKYKPEFITLINKLARNRLEWLVVDQYWEPYVDMYGKIYRKYEFNNMLKEEIKEFVKKTLEDKLINEIIDWEIERAINSAPTSSYFDFQSRKWKSIENNFIF